MSEFHNICIENVDLDLLKEQKVSLVNLLQRNTDKLLSKRETEALEGILSLLDHIQDRAENITWVETI